MTEASEGSTLLLFHCASRTGYAIETLERVFDRAARSGLQSGSRVHYAYSSITRGRPLHLDGVDSDITAVSYSQASRSYQAFQDWVAARSITRVLAFDLPVSDSISAALRNAGVRRIVSYWGASISDVYPWYALPFRQLQYRLSVGRPDHFLFESEDMRMRGVSGAGIPIARTSIARIGVDTLRFSPGGDPCYAHSVFGIPHDRRIVFFSGHMEQRKGVHILVSAFARMTSSQRQGLHLLLAGNTTEDAIRLSEPLKESDAVDHVTFAGYRKDIPQLLRSASLGVIASTGWDSFTVSAVEMAATGLPLLVSDLPGLREAVVPGETGDLVPPGDVQALADSIVGLMSNEAKREAYGVAARARVIREFSEDHQVAAIADCIYDA